VGGGTILNKTWTHRTRVRELHSQDAVKEEEKAEGGASSDLYDCIEYMAANYTKTEMQL